jgi:surfactin synthase thioesterase subunit
MHIMQPLVERFKKGDPSPDSPVLFAIPHAGAGASIFSGWRTRLPRDIEIAAIRLPGREKDISSPPHATVAAAVESIVEAIGAWHPQSLAIFGQCSGAILAFEVACEMSRRGWPAPDHVFVASQRSPEEREARALHELTDRDLFDFLRSMNTLPGGISIGDPLWDLLIPAIRADLEAMGDYTPHSRDTLESAITAIVGQDDTSMSTELVEGWRRYAPESFQARQVVGGHLVSSSPEIVNTILKLWPQSLDYAADEAGTVADER